MTHDEIKILDQILPLIRDENFLLKFGPVIEEVKGLFGILNTGYSAGPGQGKWEMLIRNTSLEEISKSVRALY